MTPPASAMLVAAGTGSSSTRVDTLMPIPTTTAASTTSARMPPSLRSAYITSFGHLSAASTCATARTASTAATPATNGNNVHVDGGTVGRSRTDNSTDDRG